MGGLSYPVNRWMLGATSSGRNIHWATPEHWKHLLPCCWQTTTKILYVKNFLKENRVRKMLKTRLKSLIVPTHFFSKTFIWCFTSSVTLKSDCEKLLAPIKSFVSSCRANKTNFARESHQIFSTLLIKVTATVGIIRRLHIRTLDAAM